MERVSSEIMRTVDIDEEIVARPSGENREHREKDQVKCSAHSDGLLLNAKTQRRRATEPQMETEVANRRPLTWSR